MNADKTLATMIIIFLIIGTIGTLYILLNPPKLEKFTEFYILGQNGKASDYPTNLSTGDKGNLTVGIVNHEDSTSIYQIKIIQGKTILKVENITLVNGEKKEIPFEFTAGFPGQTKLEFNLYKLPDTQNIYRRLSLEVNVT